MSRLTVGETVTQLHLNSAKPVGLFSYQQFLYLFTRQ